MKIRNMPDDGVRMYTLHWALSRDSGGRYYIRGNYTAEHRPLGTLSMPIERHGGEYHVWPRQEINETSHMYDDMPVSHIDGKRVPQEMTMETFSDTELRNAMADLGWSEATTNTMISVIRQSATQFTEDQLKDAMTRLHTYPAAKTRTFMERIEMLRRRNDSTTDFDNQTITRRELRERLAVVTGPEGSLSSRLSFKKPYYGVDSLVNELFRPEPAEHWEEGQVVKDADGEFWRRRGDGWERFGYIGTTNDRTPKRPLSLRF